MQSYQVHKYLERIKVKGVPAPSLVVLSLLQKQHLLHIPFENLDIHHGNLIELNTTKIFQKIVHEQRGGFCYELNGLFYELLKSIGFKVKIISARVFDEGKGYGKEYDHLALIVDLDGKEYLTDVGFGEFTFAPLEMILDEKQKDERGTFVFDKYDENYFRVNKIIKGELTPQYIFQNKVEYYLSFEDMCHYHQTSEDSHFTQKRLITIPTENGRITISGSQLKIKEKEITKERKIDEKKFDYFLTTYFNYKK